MDHIHSFPPLFTQNSRILILGTMPGVDSLKKQQYYGHSRNQFWKIICGLFGASCPESYSERTTLLLENRIALWDVIYSCRRKGSLDSNISDLTPNNIPDFLHRCPNICRIYCNGGNAFKILRKFYPSVADKYGCIPLPSTSPAYTIPYKEKLEKWTAVLVDPDKKGSFNLLQPDER